MARHRNSTGSRRAWIRRRLLPILVVSVIATAALLVVEPDMGKQAIALLAAGARREAPAGPVGEITSLAGLLARKPEDLKDVDIALMNLLCAEGLPGAEKLDGPAIRRCLHTLDQWARRVKFETDRHLYRLRDPRYADHYNHSEGRLRMEMLVQTLQDDFNVHYNMERVRDPDFTNSKDLFIHGMINDPNGGTCVSMPVVYIAVGRRLGYPLKLVQTKGHLFARWDDPNGERINIEGTGKGGVGFYPDEHYRHWPAEWTDTEKKWARYLVSLSPEEELGQFLTSRGACLLDLGRTGEARLAYAHAYRFARDDATVAGRLLGTCRIEAALLVGARDPRELEASTGTQLKSK